MCSLCLVPLLAKQLDGGRSRGYAIVVLTAAFKAHVLIVAEHLERAETVDVAVGLSVFARHQATLAAGYMYVLKQRSGRKECAHIGRFFPCHVPEIAHATHTGVVDVATDGRRVGYLTEVERFLTVQRFEDDRRPVLGGKRAEFVEPPAKEVAYAAWPAVAR